MSMHEIFEIDDYKPANLKPRKKNKFKKPLLIAAVLYILASVIHTTLTILTAIL